MQFSYINELGSSFGTYLYGRRMDETSDEVRRLKADAERDLTVDGPGLAAHALRAGLVDELQMIVCPVVAGGIRFFPDGMRLELELVEERQFRNGVLVLRYAVRGT
jgi:dihydrofolate reductase